jgi:hypothetical protein
MVCYSVPLTAALVCYAFRKTGRAEHQNYFLLNLMLAGGAIFGVIDHLWNGELFLVSGDWLFDLALGVTITLAIIASWGIMLALPWVSPATAKTEN